MSGVRIRSIFAERIKRPMKCQYGELVVVDTRGGKVVVNTVGDPKKGILFSTKETSCFKMLRKSRFPTVTG